MSKSLRQSSEAEAPPRVHSFDSTRDTALLHAAAESGEPATDKYGTCRENCFSTDMD